MPFHWRQFAIRAYASATAYAAIYILLSLAEASRQPRRHCHTIRWLRIILLIYIIMAKVRLVLPPLLTCRRRRAVDNIRRVMKKKKFQVTVKPRRDASAAMMVVTSIIGHGLVSAAKREHGYRKLSYLVSSPCCYRRRRALYTRQPPWYSHLPRDYRHLPPYRHYHTLRCAIRQPPPYSLPLRHTSHLLRKPVYYVYYHCYLPPYCHRLAIRYHLPLRFCRYCSITSLP